MAKATDTPPVKVNVQVTRSEMTALIWAARIVYWQVQVATYEDEESIGGMALSLLARAALDSAVTKLEETGVLPKRLREVSDQLAAELGTVI